MKNFTQTALLLVFSLLTALGAKAQTKPEILQCVCPSPTDKTVSADEKAMWDILLYFETVASSQKGVATDGNYIFTSSFSTEMFRKYTMDGVFIDEFTIPGISTCNCMTYDGTYFYGAKGNLSDGIFVIDLEAQTLVSTIPVSAPSVIGIGHLSFDPGLDEGNGGFWIGYWAELAAVDMSGNEIIPNTLTTNPGIAGTAYDNITDPENPGLFCFQQTGATNLEITKFDINTLSFSGVLHVATDIPGPFTTTVNETIAPGDFLNVTFDQQADLSSPGTEYTFVITALLTGDENAANDILTKMVQNTAGVYCYASGSSSASAEYISNVTIGEMSNSSGADQYANYTGDPGLYVYLEAGIASEITITLANPYNADLSAIWIDWNDNGNFYDAGEEVYVSAFGQGPYVTNIIAPESAMQNTNLRMRIRLDYNNPSPDPCGTTSFGEVEDYTVIVAGPQLNPPSNLQSEVANGDIQLVWDAPVAEDLISYKIYHSWDYSDFTVIDSITDTAYLYVSPSSGSHRFYITAVYDEGESVPSNMVEEMITGITEQHVTAIGIYPNPVSDKAVVTFSNPGNKTFDVMVMNSNGQVVKNIHNITGHEFTIRKENLSKGIYFIRICGDETFFGKLMFK